MVYTGYIYHTIFFYMGFPCFVHISSFMLMSLLGVMNSCSMITILLLDGRWFEPPIYIRMCKTFLLDFLEFHRVGAQGKGEKNSSQKYIRRYMTLGSRTQVWSLYMTHNLLWFITIFQFSSCTFSSCTFIYKADKYNSCDLYKIKLHYSPFWKPSCRKLSNEKYTILLSTNLEINCTNNNNKYLYSTSLWSNSKRYMN